MGSFVLYSKPGSFVLYSKPSQASLKKTAKQIDQWFQSNPTRKTCRLFGETVVRKDHVLEDLFKACGYPIKKTEKAKKPKKGKSK